MTIINWLFSLVFIFSPYIRKKILASCLKRGYDWGRLLMMPLTEFFFCFGTMYNALGFQYTVSSGEKYMRGILSNTAIKSIAEMEGYEVNFDESAMLTALSNYQNAAIVLALLSVAIVVWQLYVTIHRRLPWQFSLAATFTLILFSFYVSTLGIKWYKAWLETQYLLKVVSYFTNMSFGVYSVIGYSTPVWLLICALFYYKYLKQYYAEGTQRIAVDNTDAYPSQQPNDNIYQDTQTSSNNGSSTLTLSTDRRLTKKCLYCNEEILAVAKKCKYCNTWLTKDIAFEKQNEKEPNVNQNKTKQDSISICVFITIAIICLLTLYVYVEKWTPSDVYSSNSFQEEMTYENNLNDNSSSNNSQDLSESNEIEANEDESTIYGILTTQIISDKIKTRMDAVYSYSIEYATDGDENTVRSVNKYICGFLHSNNSTDVEAAAKEYVISIDETLESVWSDEEYKPENSPECGIKIDITENNEFYVTIMVDAFLDVASGTSSGVWDLKDQVTILTGTGKRITAENLFSNLSAVADIVQQEIERQANCLREFAMPDLPPVLTREGVCFRYRKDEIACTADSDLKCTIPYEELLPYMNENIRQLLP
jgi:energy-coupling factor transporter transmembrane protein EcfT